MDMILLPENEDITEYLRRMYEASNPVPPELEYIQSRPKGPWLDTFGNPFTGEAPGYPWDNARFAWYLPRWRGVRRQHYWFFPAGGAFSTSRQVLSFDPECRLIWLNHYTHFSERSIRTEAIRQIVEINHAAHSPISEAFVSAIQALTLMHISSLAAIDEITRKALGRIVLSSGENQSFNPTAPPLTPQPQMFVSNTNPPTAVAPVSRSRDEERLVATLERARQSLSADEITDLIEKATTAAQVDEQPNEASERFAAEMNRGVRRTSEERRKLRLAALTDSFAHRRRLLKGALPLAEVSERLGIDQNTLLQRIADKQTLAVWDGKLLKLPDWQFDPNGQYDVLPGLPEVLTALDLKPLDQLSWLMTPKGSLRGRTPVNALQAGQAKRVIAEAHATNAW